MEWIYKGKPLKQVPEGYVGFVYMIVNNANGFIYIGKKVFNFTRKVKLTKKDKLLPENKRKKFKVVISDSKWQDYWGSSATLLADLEIYGKESFSREILMFCRDKTELTYKEVWYQFHYDVLNRNSYNNTILGRFYKKKIKTND
jgi:hypothetical protein